jgi:hypothetical protein
MDELPLHQVPLSLAHAATSDRNFYDRCYLNAHDRTGEVFVVTGLGVYPNLGVVDAFATVRHGDRQVTVRCSDALGEDRSRQEVGPYRVEVVEALRRLRVVCDADDHGLGLDLAWTGSFPAVEEQPHVWRRDGRVVLDACRFAQVGTWSGTVRVDGRTWQVSDDRWVGSRDRSWGIRPVGEPEPPGRAGAEPDPGFGFFWTYVPLRFDRFALVVIVQEDGEGHRVLNDAVRVWPDGRVEQLGWPRLAVRYRPGTRHPEGATISLRTPGGADVVVEVETLGFVALNCGPGYGGDPEWVHGQWLGRQVVQRSECDYGDPEVQARVPFGTVDHVARATLDGEEGWGMFEHMVVGRHAPSGFADFTAVAPGPPPA